MIAVVGLGLIGTSLGLAWRRAGLDRRLVGIDPDPGARQAASGMGAFDETAEGLDAAAGAQVVVLAAPPSAVLAMAGEVARVAAPGAVVTDVCSVKAPVVHCYEEALAARAFFVGGHPMAGKAAAGAAAAEAGLFSGRPWILTPTPATDPGALHQVGELARAAGARVVHLDPDEHDRRVSLVSHLPQLAATALMLAAAGIDGAEQVAGPGLRDTTRLAASPGALWGDVLTLNADAVVEAARAFSQHFAALVDAVARRDAGAVRRIIDAGAAARRRLEEVC